MPIAPKPAAERQTIVIAGAGIAGLTAALSLAAIGLRVVLCEKTEKLSELGAGIQLAPNAGRVLARLGLDRAIAAAAIEPAALEIRNGLSGRLLTAVPAAAFRTRYEFPYRVIHRADLQSILAKAASLQPAIRLYLGATVESTAPRPDGLLVRVRKREGVEVVSASAVIAADGVWSTHREKVRGSMPPAPAGRTVWRALIPGDVAGSITPRDRTGLWLGPEAHLVHYPVAQGAAVNLVAIIEEKWPRQGWSSPGEAAEIAERFRTWCKPVRDLIAAPVAWQKFAVATVRSDGEWVSERLALIGDAAHAMVPFLAQGGAMAIEDAAVLADCLYGIAGPGVPAALLRYASARKARVAKVAEASQKTGDAYHLGGMLGTLRDAALTVGGARLVLGMNDWIYRWRPDR
ncbi:FAD-dependent monooxygenase [soil metagenome]